MSLGKVFGAIIVLLIVIIIAIWFMSDLVYVYLFRAGLNRMKEGCLRIYSSHDGSLLHEVNRSDVVFGEIYTSDFNGLCRAVVRRSDIGLGEEYMRGTWTSPNIIDLLTVLVMNDKEMQSRFRFNTRIWSDDAQNIKAHYDAGNDFYLRFLRDDLNAYTCGFYLCQGDTLNQAQYNKVHTIIKKLETKPDMKILDIGCGWGKIADYVSRTTKCHVDGVTLAKEQVKHIMSKYPHIHVFDRIYSIGMFEHVRCPNYGDFFRKVSELLKPGGRCVLHTITFGINSFSTCGGQTKTFISEHVFPGGQIPAKEWIVDAAGISGLKLVHMEVFGGQHYGKTLTHWMQNILRSAKELNDLGYDDSFIRKYEFYMAECTASFNADRLNVTHFVYDKVPLLTEAKAQFQCNN
jgi:cyclopropane-fatty-acyl-phospholipid synthase